jgi:hypothetical protein
MLWYGYYMTLTVEVKEEAAIKLLNDLESQGLINVKPVVSQEKEKAAGRDYNSFLQLRGIHKNIPGASVEDFLARCREDKEYELAIEKREEEERARLAKAKISS